LGIYRDRFEIIANILEIVGNNAKKTQIMYQANLSYTVLQKYLLEITGASLIDHHDIEQYYYLTPKGQEFLDVYRKYTKNSKSAEKHQSIVDNNRKALADLCMSKDCSASKITEKAKQ
jgi:predicted transcriptional regulator